MKSLNIFGLNGHTVKNAPKNPVERAPKFIAAHVSIMLVIGLFAIFSAVGAVKIVQTLHFPEPFGLILSTLAAMLALTIAIIPIVSAPAWTLAKSETGSKAIGLILIAAFVVMDAGLEANALMQADAMMRAKEIAEIKADREHWESALLVASEAKQEAISRQLAVTDDNLDAAQKPSISFWLIFLLMMGFQTSAFFFRSWLTSVTEAKDAELLEARREKRQSYGKQRLRVVA